MSIKRASSAFGLVGTSAPAASTLHLLYKHSPVCGVSYHALIAVSDFAARNPEVPVTLVDVVEQRALSRRLTRELYVAHASPQVIFVRDGVAEWVASDGRISVTTLEGALADLSASAGSDATARSA